ncbi:MAG: asparagine synthase (glutamine-hydrolyzing) [Deltaproteobacteria bacterium]|nr:asparagine synthase (glutamine-hydrolyzing) [Deltaproteobacteria bacterium]
MCTIVVTFNEKQPQILRKMVTAVSHRGPDSVEVWTNEHHGAAGCRLSIFGDREAPMIFQDQVTGQIVLLNGEIYNYHSLWKDLSKQGHYPRTDLEAELVARLYQIHGMEFTGRLKGMFAIAIIDDSQLILARDRFGIKPLYYTEVDKSVLVCSEIKGILCHPKVSPILNTTALEETRVFGYVHSQDETFFQGIKQVSPGTAVCFNSGGIIHRERFGVLPQAHYLNGVPAYDYPAATRETRRRVIQAVERMFEHGSMEKGLYLSGGIDSTTLACVARRELGYPLQTFTLADSPDTDDIKAARMVARTLGTDHREFLVSMDDYWRWLPDYVAHYESLMAGGVFHIQGGLAFHLLSRFVAQHVRVAFSGEGADELFGGYYWIYTHPLGFSDRIRGNLSAVKENERLRNLVETLFPQPEEEKLYRRNLFDDLLRGGLSNYHLQSVDRSGGAFGFEIRPLYLDDDLSQWAMELPIEYKVPDKNMTKKILRDAFDEDYKKLGLAWVPKRLKMGMPSAIAKLDTEIHKKVDLAISDEEIFQHPFGKILGSKINLLIFDIFDHIFFQGWDHHADTPPPGSFLARLWPE